MQKLIETLKNFGIEIPEEKHSDIKKALSEHYKNAAEYSKTVNKLETERDNWKKRAETAETTLQGFDGKDFETIERDRDEWKRKAETAESEYNAKIAEREKADLLKEAFSEIKFTSEAAKKSIMAQISENVSVKNGKLIGFNDLLEDAKKNDASAFVDEQQQQLENNKARFTSKSQPQPDAGKKYTISELMRMKNENPGLDISQYINRKGE